MSFIDVAIPGVLGLLLLAWPQAVFLGSRATPTERKLRLLRYCGGALLAVSLLYLTIKLAGR